MPIFWKNCCSKTPQINHMLYGLETLWNMKKQDHPANSSNLTIYANMLKVSHDSTLALHSHHHILFWKCSLKSSPCNHIEFVLWKNSNQLNIQTPLSGVDLSHISNYCVCIELMYYKKTQGSIQRAGRIYFKNQWWPSAQRHKMS